MISYAGQTVVLPFDFSAPSKEAIEKVLQSSDESTSCHVVFVVEPSYSLISADPAMAVPATIDDETRASALKKMHEVFDEKAKKHKIEVHAKIGDPGSEIVALAKAKNADLIVMPSHGRTGIKRLLLGSVAERVLRLSSCPVLVYRGDLESHAQLETISSTVISGTHEPTSLVDRDS